MQLSKYNASGNDFVVFHSLARADRSDLARALCDRFEGLGADGLIVLVPDEQNDFAWEFYNSDGSLANMCGNGSRAAFMYAFEHGFCGSRGSFLSGAGVIKGGVEDYAISNLTSQASQARPCDEARTEFAGLRAGERFSLKTALVEVALTNPKKLAEPFSEEGFEWRFFDTGVPHLVAFVDELSAFDLALCAKMRAKYDANVNFAKKTGANKLAVRTFERGVEGETLACGTGMAACFYAAREAFGVGERATLNPKSGEDLFLRFDGEKIHFKGRVRHTFDAVI